MKSLTLAELRPLITGKDLEFRRQAFMRQPLSDLLRTLGLDTEEGSR